jgi:cell division protease FtsH
VTERTIPIRSLPTTLRDEDAVEAACAADINFIEERIRRSQSVLVECDKELSLYLYLAVRARLRRTKDGPKLVVIDGRQRPEEPCGPALPRMITQLADAVRGTTERTAIVLLHLDVLTTSHSGLTIEARESIPLLYENPEAVLVGFRDPSFEIPKVIRDVFAARREITGVSRDALAKIVTQREALAIHPTEFDPYALYRYVSGLNPLRCRRVFAQLAARHEALPGRDRADEVYAEIRQQTAEGDVELPQVDLERDIGGYGEVKARLREEFIELATRRDPHAKAEDVQSLEALLPRGIIFHGPPGTGKTYFAKAIATALKATVLVVSGPELKSKWVGESEENLRRIFRRARKAAPSVLVFDELDAFAHARGTYAGSGVEHSMVNQLLSEMDGFRKNEMVFVVGTTNFLESLDAALLRPGRFEYLIEVPAPSAEDRETIARIYDRKLGLGLSDALVKHIVRRTEGLADPERGLPFTGDHIHTVCRALKRQVIRTGAPALTADDVDRAIQRKSRRPVVLSPTEERVVAVHEAGHALVAILLPRATPPERVSIASDVGGALGYVQRMARARPYALTESDLRADVCVGLAGLVAERLFLGEISVGARTDLQQASALVCEMVDHYGMSAVGRRALVDDKHERWSEGHAQARDAAIARILQEEEARAESVLSAAREEHAALVALLLEKKVLDGTMLRTIARKDEPCRT